MIDLPIDGASSHVFREGILLIACDHRRRLLAVALVHGEERGVDLTVMLAGVKVCPCCTRSHKEAPDRPDRELCDRCAARLDRLTAPGYRRRQRSKPRCRTSA